MRNALVLMLLLVFANVCWAGDVAKATGTLDGKAIKFSPDRLAEGVKATIGLLESCHSENVYQADELNRTLQGDYVRLVFPKSITASIMNEKVDFSELVFRLPMNTGVFWVRSGERWLRYSKHEFEKEKPFTAWLSDS